MRIRTLLVCLLSSFTLQPSALPQGPLTPPGRPGPTMKTLDQVEARTIINAANTPGDSLNLFIISAPGSYYLTGNITGVSGKNGIKVIADNVTLDLNGFALIGVTGSSSGIIMIDVHRNLRIHNGSARSWPQTALHCPAATNSQFDHLYFSNNRVAFVCGDGCVLSQISAEVSADVAIETGSNCTLTACYAGNSVQGFLTGDSCTITASTSVGNSSVGFNIQSGCTIIGCTASSNGFGIYPGDYCTVKDCNASLNIHGIWVGSKSLIANCTASQNKDSGITAYSNCQIISNEASANAGGCGIETLNPGNRIDGNHCIGNASYGIKSSAPNADYIMRNTCNGNGGVVSATATANYSPKSGPYFGVLSYPGDANPSPWANFSP